MLGVLQNIPTGKDAANAAFYQKQPIVDVCVINRGFDEPVPTGTTPTTASFSSLDILTHIHP